MDLDAHKSRQALIEELRTLRRQLGARGRVLEPEKAANCRTDQVLPPADVIIANSPAILFRRLAAADPKQRRMVYVSPNIARFGYRAEDFLSGRIMFRDILYPGDSDRTLKEIQSYVDQKLEAYTQIYRIVTRNGDVRWIEDRTSVVTDPATGVRYHQGIIIDIHRRKEAEDQLRKSEEKYRRIVETAGEGFLLMDEAWKIVDLNAALCRMLGLTRRDILGQSLHDLASEKYRSFLTDRPEDRKSSAYHELEAEFISRSDQPVPVLVHANTLRDDTGAIIGNMAFITDMTEQKKALALAGEVQRSLLPQESPRVPGLDIAGRNVPCDEVGGDYFDFLWRAGTPERPFTAVVGDITGHGVDSALLMTSARAFLRMRAAQPGTLPDIVTAMNRHLTEDVHATGRFMTLFYLTIGADRCHIEWVRAGHDPAWLYDPDQDRFEELKGPGLALGIDATFSFRSSNKTGLKKGQVIIVGTDGIWEGCNPEKEMFGKQRLKAIIRENPAASAETLLDSVFEAQAQFTRGTRAEDDLTLVIIKITP
ncbi:MAG: SpoIIE family protein phosphatase [Desulfosarcina sp.]|nr:SpoIIE family protein phosphatase [Desulfobacterales bacterium]